jgi:hypothetical protein
MFLRVHCQASNRADTRCCEDERKHHPYHRRRLSAILLHIAQGSLTMNFFGELVNNTPWDYH